MHIVELLAASSGGLSLAAMTEALQIPKTSLLNHLKVLVTAGYVNSRDARYTLGPASMRLGAVIASDTGVLAASRPVAAELVARSGETAMIATLDERAADAFYIDVIDSQQDIRYSPRIGSRWPLYCTGLGRALLAFQHAGFIRRYLAETDMPRRTKQTIIDRTRLQRIVEGIRATGVVVTQGEHTAGAAAVAAPIIERDGSVHHAIGIGVPIARLEPRRELLIKLVTDAARQVSWTLGGRGTRSALPAVAGASLPRSDEASRRARIARPTTKTTADTPMRRPR
ncbi:IclR family transcriptional regulator [Piscinibacter sakaiensis]|uniref:IclR family transcriptional regulator n=1 Tax=Piscinibacter sakaiensis TaxID=1547922 RepID=UPI003AAE58CD